MNHYHTPVLLNESIEALKINSNGTYIDLTFGGGGHSQAILKKLEKRGRLFAFDQDPAAVENASKLDCENFVFFESNACYLKYFMNFYAYKEIDGIFMDLGVSSHQIDTADRGFSTRFNGPLDMRMNTKCALTASIVVNTYPEKQLTKLFLQYGEIHNASEISSAIVKERHKCKIDTTEHLCKIIDKFCPLNKRNKCLAKAFQALRIEVNNEIEVLQKTLIQATDLLKRGGRLVVISYHSLEDRVVKRFMATGSFSNIINKDIYGNIIRPITPIYTKCIKPSQSEISDNNRARSARLRVAEK